MEDVNIITCHGEEILPYLDAAARLRIEVFREYPYLYDGSEEYEREYLAHYLQSPGSVFVCALSNDKVIGISTALPLKDADESFQLPFLQHGKPITEIYYLGESVLQPAYRGRGIGHAFFDHRENRARELGYRSTTFCSVLRAPDHRLCPQGYRDHKNFWSHRHYRPNGLYAELTWKQIDSIGEMTNRLEFWQRDL
jgi:GNAT superfamily N-acetyltransferase